jgi:hypothetical protein
MPAPKFNLTSSTVSKGIKMANEGMKSLIGRKMTKVVKFMGEDVKINKLSVAEVMEIQTAAKDAENDEAKGFNILKTILRDAVEGAAEISDEDFNNFPMDELSKLSNEIMKFSGISGEEGKGK